VQAHGSALVAWNKICKPKKQGGLGVLNLEVQNKALLLKTLDKFYNNVDVPWVQLVKVKYYNNGTLPGMSPHGSFWWRAHLKLLGAYKAMTRCNLGNGKTAYFWTDLWVEECLSHQLPHLVTFAKGLTKLWSKLFKLNICRIFFIYLYHSRLSRNSKNLNKYVTVL
jgi:hypothetical protein